MQMKTVPVVGLRYWIAIAIASMCGANLGDIIPDTLKLDTGTGLILLTMTLAGLVLVERVTTKRSETFYWAAILIVRAAATNIADYAIVGAHFTYLGTWAGLALAMVILITLYCVRESRPTNGTLPSADGLYWFTMLTAGTLGTVMADGIGHAIQPVNVGVPVSALLATLTTLTILRIRNRMASSGAASYWISIVSIRWWGTNVGDILAFLLSPPVSAAMTGLTLATLLVLWRTPRTGFPKTQRAKA
ncbi:hypothetical protein [Burkholderia pyrrocinia]|uniref:hypothetical protein n=1 Tax=Burkholderia pyrrocinia TaxID=60550 RepID=UPI002AB15A48|nr:hypothetical protein [Burkholderia pyrrocinia]